MNPESQANLHDRRNVGLRVRWVNELRRLVAPSCPVNKVGAALVSDVDLLLAPQELRDLALRNVIGKEP